MNAKEFHGKETGRKAEGEEGEGRTKLDHLVEQGEWMQLKDNGEFRAMSIEGKIATAMQTVDTRIGQMTTVFMRLLVRHPKDAGIVLDNEIKPMRSLNEALAARLAGEFKQKKNGMSEEVDSVLGIDRRENQSPVSGVALKRAA